MPKNSVGLGGRQNAGNGAGADKSNNIRTLIFVCLIAVLVTALMINMNNNGGMHKTEVPISEVIAQANNPDGGIEKITVSGDTVDVTLKGESQPTETSRKDGSGTLYDMGLKTLDEFCEGWLRVSWRSARKNIQ